jgi:predicted AAA+ superfamily ATPase
MSVTNMCGVFLMVERTLYLKVLADFKDKNLIKVITGIRRSGKSILLQQFCDYLKASGVDEDRIVMINFESLHYENIKDYKALYQYISKTIIPNKTTYILLDEIQEVSNWEKALASFQVDFQCDIYITGSNAYMLSSELATHISGRYVEIHMLPLSFREYLSGVKADKDLAFNQYLEYGGLPGLLELNSRDDLYRHYMEGVYNTIVIKDILGRSNIKETDLLESILLYMIDNIGNLISANNIANYLTSSGRKTYPSTVSEYLNSLEKAFVLYKAKRYNIRGKRLLSSPYKYYLVDTGFRNIVLGRREMDIGRVLENIVYLELKRRGYDLKIGIESNFEVDFVASRGTEKSYYQVCLSIADDDVRKRELRSLQMIKDNYPKFLLTMDFHVKEEISGIKLLNIKDFLLED